MRKVASNTLVLALALVLQAPFLMSQRLTMADALSEAISKNFRLAIARLDSATANAMERTGKAGYYPTLDATANGVTGVNNISQRTASGVSIDRAGAGFTNINANATMQWTLFDGFRMMAVDDQMSSLADAERERARGSYARVIADVMTRYVGVVAAERALAGARTALVLAERRLELAQRRRETGQASATAVAQAEIDRNNVSVQAERLRTARELSRSGLSTLLVRDVRDSFAVDTSIAMPPLPLAAELEAALLGRNPDILAAERQVQAATASERQIASSFWPRIDAVGGLQLTNNTTEAGFILENRTTGWSAGLQMRYNIFRGAADAQASEMARVETLRRRAEIDDLRSQMRLQLASAIERYEQGRRVLDTERRTLEAAQRNADVTLEAYRQGLVDDMDVRQSQQSLVEIITRRAQTEFDTYAAAIEALRLAGRLVW
ncbi:MAG: TolC family protein [Candidatus Kapabacteria bacterium]|nr:TolC family protein [Candidatus Kapabacteria bacterium]